MAGGASVDGTGTAARFTRYNSIYYSRKHDILLVRDDSAVIRSINTVTGATSILAGTRYYGGSADGPVATATIEASAGFTAMDSNGNVYFTQGYCIRKVSGGNVNVWVGNEALSGNTDNSGTNARFNSITGLAFDDSDNLYVGQADCIRKITTAGKNNL